MRGRRETGDGKAKRVGACGQARHDAKNTGRDRRVAARIVRTLAQPISPSSFCASDFCLALPSAITSSSIALAPSGSPMSR